MPSPQAEGEWIDEVTWRCRCKPNPGGHTDPSVNVRRESRCSLCNTARPGERPSGGRCGYPPCASCLGTGRATPLASGPFEGALIETERSGVLGALRRIAALVPHDSEVYQLAAEYASVVAFEQRREVELAELAPRPAPSARALDEILRVRESNAVAKGRYADGYRAGLDRAIAEIRERDLDKAKADPPPDIVRGRAIIEAALHWRERERAGLVTGIALDALARVIDETPKEPRTDS